MERIFSAAPFFYGATAEKPNTFRISFELKDAVDGRTLEEAVSDAMERYPYFKVKVVSEGSGFMLADNDSPVVVRNQKEPVVLGGSESNGHLIAFAYEGKWLHLDCFHGMTDGAGVFPLVRTLLYYYCGKKYHAALSSEGINKKDDPIGQEEIVDPYPERVDEKIQPIGRYLRRGAFQLACGKDSGNAAPVAWHIKIREEALIKYSKQNDGSPGVMAALLLARAIEEIHKDKEFPVVCGMAMNIRPVLKKPTSHHSVVSQLFLEYKESMKEMSIQDQATAFRGMVILQSQPENIWISVRNNISFIEKLNQQQDIAGKKRFMQEIVKRSMGADTFKVSYVGRASLGEAGKYVENIHSYIDIDGAGIMMEINAHNGWFDICFMQEFEEDIYLKGFQKQLQQADISCEVTGPEPIRVSAIAF